MATPTPENLQPLAALAGEHSPTVGGRLADLLVWTRKMREAVCRVWSVRSLSGR